VKVQLKLTLVSQQSLSPHKGESFPYWHTLSLKSFPTMSTHMSWWSRV